MEKPILCIDLDDVLSETYETIIKYAVMHDKLNLGRNGIINTNINSNDHYYFARCLGWSREDLISFFDKYYPDYLEEIKPKEETTIVLESIRKMNIKICIVTARRERKNKEVLSITKKWLKNNNIYYDEIYVDSCDKGEIIKEKKAKYFIDDSLENCLNVKEKSKATNVFWLETKYNKNICCNNKEIIKISSLKELIDNIRRLEMKSRLIIDGHSHCGLDIFHGYTGINEYIDFAKKSGINVGLIMPVPVPCTSIEDPNSRYMWWTIENEKLKYHGDRNPFQFVNYSLYRTIEKIKDDSVKLLFIPEIHPALDDAYELEKLINDTDPVALKVHGIGSGVGPDDFSKEIIDVIKKYELPLILHTDRDNGKTVDKTMIYIRNINDSEKWAKFLIENEIHGTLNHGASLNKKTFELANKTEFIKVALGPDLVSCLDENRLATDCRKDYKTYLRILRDNLSSNRIIYDADYNWNTLGDEDYNSIDRVMEVFETFEEQDKIFSENIIEHYPKLTKKLGG